MDGQASYSQMVSPGATGCVMWSGNQGLKSAYRRPPLALAEDPVVNCRACRRAWTHVKSAAGGANTAVRLTDTSQRWATRG